MLFLIGGNNHSRDQRIEPVNKRLLWNGLKAAMFAALARAIAWIRKPIVWNGLKYGLGIGLLVFMVWRNWAPAGGQGLQAVVQRHFVEGEPLHWLALVLALVICLTGVLLTFVRWYVLVRAQDLPFTFSNAIRLGLVGFFFSTFLPGSVGGDIIKAAFIAKEQSRRTVAVSTVLIDRGVGLWGLCWLVALLGGVFWYGGSLEGAAATTLQSIVVFSALICAATTLVWVLLGFLPEWRAQRFARRLTKIPKLGHSAAEFWRAIWMYRNRRRSIALALGLSLIGHVCFVLTFYFSALTLYQANGIPTVQEHFMIVPVGMTFQASIPTPGGMGAGELGFGALYNLIHFPEGRGVMASIVQRVITWILAFGGYVVYLRLRPSLPPVSSESWPEESQDRPAVEEAPVSTGTAPTLGGIRNAKLEIPNKS
jgi:uncharacterized protein (TIRG00374 family)